MKTFYFILQVFLLAIIGACGLALLLGGIYMQNIISSLFGVVALLFSVIYMFHEDK